VERPLLSIVLKGTSFPTRVNMGTVVIQILLSDLDSAGFSLLEARNGGDGGRQHQSIKIQPFFTIGVTWQA
jgi:hypothetical protein